MSTLEFITEQCHDTRREWTMAHSNTESWFKTRMIGFPGGTVVENLPANAGDTDSSPGLGRSHMPQSN